MKKCTLRGLALLSFATIGAQQPLFEKQLPQDFKIKNSLQIGHTGDHSMSLLFMDNKRTMASLINGDLVETTAFQTDPLPRKYNIPLGAEDKGIRAFVLFLTNKSHDGFAMVEFDFNKKASKMIPLGLEFKKETFLEAFSHHGKVFVLSINNQSSVLNFYVLHTDGSHTKNILDLSGEKFRHWDNALVNMYTLMARPYGSREGKLLTLIDAHCPNSLELSAAASKLFLEEDAFYLTFESNRNITQIVKIDPKDFSYSLTSFNKPYIPNAPDWKKANSFLFDGKYLGVTATTDELRFEVTDYGSREKINSFMIGKNTEIGFKNTPINVKGLYGANPREVENGNRFLRDMANMEIGVSIYPDKGGYIVTLGTFEKVTPSINLLQFPIADLGFINLMGVAYFNMAMSRSTYFKSIFDPDFQHREGTVPLSSFEKIQAFLDGQEEIQKSDVFDSNGQTVLGYLDDQNMYRVVSFW